MGYADKNYKCLCHYSFFFFFKQKTAYEIYQCDWSSDVCSSDLNILQRLIWSLIDTWNPHPYIVIKQILRKERPDIVHIHTPIAVSLSVFNAVKSLNIPIVFTLHEYFLICKRSFLLRGKEEICYYPNMFCRFYRRLSKKIVDSMPDVVISPSKFALDMMVKHGFFEHSMKIVLPNGIAIPERPIVHIDNSYIDVLYLGSLSRHKGVHLLVKAFAEIDDKKLRLHIAGGGPLLEYLKKSVRDNDRIKFYGWISGEEKDGLLRLADILVLPSIWFENFPVSIQESFCYSTPVIGSKIGGIPELIRDDYNGFLFEPGNVSELKNILEGLTKDPVKLKKLGANAYSSALEFDMNKHIEKLLDIYSSVI